jgi:hypothetical protein
MIFKKYFPHHKKVREITLKKMPYLLEQKKLNRILMG